MTHEYTIALRGLVLGTSWPFDNPPTAIAWAADRVLAVGSDADVRAISRGDSTFIDLAGSIVTQAPDDEAAAVHLVRAAVAGGFPFDPVEVMSNAGLLTSGGPLEPGSAADLALWSANPGASPPTAASSVRIIGIVRAGGFTQGDEHTGPFARLPRPGAERAPSPGTPDWLWLAGEFNDEAGASYWREVLAAAAYPDARDEALALWREMFDDWLIERGLPPGPGSFADVLLALGLSERLKRGPGGSARPGAVSLTPGRPRPAGRGLPSDPPRATRT